MQLIITYEFGIKVKQPLRQTIIILPRIWWGSIPDILVTWFLRVRVRVPDSSRALLWETGNANFANIWVFSLPHLPVKSHWWPHPPSLRAPVSTGSQLKLCMGCLAPLLSHVSLSVCDGPGPHPSSWAQWIWLCLFCSSTEDSYSETQQQLYTKSCALLELNSFPKSISATLKRKFSGLFHQVVYRYLKIVNYWRKENVQDNHPIHRPVSQDREFYRLAKGIYVGLKKMICLLWQIPHGSCSSEDDSETVCFKSA